MLQFRHLLYFEKGLKLILLRTFQLMFGCEGVSHQRFIHFHRRLHGLSRIASGFFIDVKDHVSTFGFSFFFSSFLPFAFLPFAFQMNPAFIACTPGRASTISYTWNCLFSPVFKFIIRYSIFIIHYSSLPFCLLPFAFFLSHVPGVYRLHAGDVRLRFRIPRFI